MTIRNEYFRWLYGRVENGYKSYLKLSKYLDGIRFRSTIANDINREQDAIREREIYLDSINGGLPSDLERKFLREPVSVFEVMFSLVKRIDYNIDDLERQYDLRLPRWYLEILENLELEELSDDNFSTKNIQKITYAINFLLDRKYNPNGHGSFFPLRKNPGKNMAKTEIWYQMMYYLEENYP